MTTAVITFRESDTVARALLDMHLARIRHIPVVDERNHVVGVLSNRNLLAIAHMPDGGRVRIGDVMTRMVRTIRQEAPAHEAASVMLDAKIGCLPVVGDEQQIVGIVTETDFLEFAWHALGGRTSPRAA